MKRGLETDRPLGRAGTGGLSARRPPGAGHSPDGSNNLAAPAGGPAPASRNEMLARPTKETTGPSRCPGGLPTDIPYEA